MKYCRYRFNSSRFNCDSHANTNPNTDIHIARPSKSVNKVDLCLPVDFDLAQTGVGCRFFLMRTEILSPRITSSTGAGSQAAIFFVSIVPPQNAREPVLTAGLSLVAR